MTRSRSKGVEVALSLDEVDAGTLVIRSHGVAPEIIENARAKGLDVIDATCPHVSKAHEAAEALKNEGYAIVIVGEAEHPEVEGILAHAGGDALVVGEASELPDPLPSRRIGVVVQTTQSTARLAEVVDALLPRVRDLRVVNTICSATGQAPAVRRGARRERGRDRRRRRPQLREHHAPCRDLPVRQRAHLPRRDR